MGPMAPIEAGILAVLAVFAWTWRSRLRAVAFRRELAAVALASWIAEDASLRLYAFHEYAAGWTASLDRVPLVVALAWPVLILSARDIALALAKGDAVKSLARTGAIVFADAALVLPIATHAGIVRWHSGGPFGVPIVAILAWSVVAWAISLALVKGPVLAAWLPPLLAHAIVFAAWWGALRWIPAPPDAGAAVFAVVIAVFFAATTWRKAPPPISGAVILGRFAAACALAALLASGAPPSIALAAWSAGFALPWLTIVRPRGVR